MGADGTVTLRGPGVAKIMITAAATGEYARTEKQITITVRPAKVSSVKAAGGKGSVTVSWKRDEKAGGYQILCARNRKFTRDKKTVTVKNPGTVKKTISGLGAGKTCYVKVRAYKKAGGGNIYGAYSAVKKVKVK